MSSAITSVDQHLYEALSLLRKEESDRVAAFDREMAHLRQRISAIQSALAPAIPEPRQLESPTNSLLPFGSPPKAGRTNFTVPSDLIGQLRGLTQPEALVKIAQYYDGILRTVEAKQILIKARLITGNPKNALSHMYALLKDSDRFHNVDGEFEKVGPGVFRLIPKKNELETDEVGEGSRD